MILSGKEIKNQNGYGLLIKPFSDEQLGPNSYNLRIADELVIYSDPVLDMCEPPITEKIRIPKGGYVLTPGRVYLARTVEYTESDCYVPMLEGRSSIGRLGLQIHVTAGFGDIGFKGYWTLELVAAQPVRIYPNTQICQIYFHTILGDYEPYNGKYQNSTGIEPSKIFLDGS